ncbi:nitrate/nitrite transporter [Alkalibacillus salilacus]|uniref:NNP family nitrate/nitrite transporter-like MFS transporter n=1 Tax=Alkalibacillus salilacus TaxID=284582 RepID=A0ABT9VBJ5_9BACI|nr:nitrate/nitrite transporter [Alkalibacillus salilacus]MDQ0158284.1 NNP family nitrate/nitrite transporter-like MFS transporter [Alkalibacillus salilacus]
MIKKVQLPLQTMNLLVGFMVWVIISALIPFMQEDIQIAPERISLLTAVPVILGSVLRIPLGYYANLIGARITFIVSFILLLLPVFYISEASSFTDLLIGGIFLGIGGAIFSVGVTSLPKYYEKEKHGLVNGIYSVGNVGTAVTTFAAPVIASQIGWSATVKLYLVLLLIFAVLNIFLGDRKEEKVKQPIISQIQGVYKNEKLWLFSLFYFITFGSFVAFTVYLPNFLVTHFGLESVDAGMRTAGFIVVATFIRPVGGWLGDRFSPQHLLVGVFSIYTFAAILLAFSPSIELYTIGTLAIAVSAGIGNGVIFKLVPMYFSKQAGIANGIVSMMGGLGGFFPPIILSTVFAITGHYAIGFMLLSQLALASLVLVFWMIFQGKLEIQTSVFNSTNQGIMVTKKDSTIVSVNPAFTRLTGYTEDEIIGETPSLLKSGEQDQSFYDHMWSVINEQGEWQGEIWNRRKNGELYLEWLTISEIRDDAGEVTHYVGTFSDITNHQEERREA